MTDAVCHVGFALLAAGTLLLARKQRPGWLFLMAGTVALIAAGIIGSLTSVVVWNVGFFAVHLRGWLGWKKQPSPPKEPTLKYPVTIDLGYGAVTDEARARGNVVTLKEYHKACRYRWGADEREGS